MGKEKSKTRGGKRGGGPADDDDDDTSTNGAATGESKQCTHLGDVRPDAVSQVVPRLAAAKKAAIAAAGARKGGKAGKGKVCLSQPPTNQPIRLCSTTSSFLTPMFIN
jgi:hypothetical protein